jgi:hypothetical protein
MSGMTTPTAGLAFADRYRLEEEIGRGGAAVVVCAAALRAGFGAGDRVACDPDLDSLRDLPRFQRLVWK